MRLLFLFPGLLLASACSSSGNPTSQSPDASKDAAPSRDGGGHTGDSGTHTGTHDGSIHDSSAHDAGHTGDATSKETGATETGAAETGATDASFADAQVLLGAHVGEAKNLDASEGDFVAFETMVGRTMGIDSDYEDWEQDASPVGFPNTARIAWDHAQGRVTMISWRIELAGANTDGGCATWSDITGGVYDTALNAQAAAVKATGITVLVRWNYEMTDNQDNTCFNDDMKVDPSTFATAGPNYVAAWKYVVDLFRTAGVTNVQWVWAPSAGLFSGADGGVDTQSWQLFYPGASYVDWIANDHYNKGQTVESYATDTEIANFYSQVSGLGKPLMQSETAANSVAPQVEWIDTIRSALKQEYPKFQAIVWWDTAGGAGSGSTDAGSADAGGSYALVDAGLAAFKKMARDPYFERTTLP